ncbi:MAG: flippase-like domain-containing protein [Gemmatimonadetes bacterium]|nr:flippase-like domain-containing protein [Gemmatimonadota bacterium]MBT8402223.1 flippase-like domain-containing protein [Gemmatimonadota bacterium]NNK64308.1 flippase-like domain-containing protein [Gemmatimonadota bacterium]
MNAVLQRSRRPLALSVVAAAGVYLLAIALADGSEVWERLRALSPGAVAVLLALPTFGFAVRFVRWDVYLRALGHHLPRPRHARIYWAGFALTTTPGKVGENLRAVYLRAYGVPVAHSVGAFVAERLGDLVAMLFLSGLTFGLLERYSAAVAATSALTVALLVALRSPGLPDWLEGGGGTTLLARVRRMAGHGVAAARDLLGTRLLVAGVAIALLAWGAEALTFVLAARWIGVDLPLGVGMGVFALGTLLGAVSMLPGGVGPTEAVMGGLLMLAGGTAAEATAATVLVRAVTLWWAVALGMVALVGLTGPEEPAR